MIKWYIQKPVKIQAIQFDGVNQEEIVRWVHLCGGRALYNEFRKTVAVSTIDGTSYAGIGDWIVKGARGEFFSYAGNIFNDVYHEAPSEDEDDD